MDTLPLPRRPRIEHYRNWARELVVATTSTEPDAVREWASRWLESLAGRLDVTISPFVRGSIDRAIETIEERIGDQRALHAPDGRFELSDAQFCIAEAHGFASWEAFSRHLEELSIAQPAFERAADAVVSGDLATLEAMLRLEPELIHARSSRVHRATLLHYVAANGVEDFRQRSPANAVDVARSLLGAGAEVDALAETYGGGPEQTTMNLLVSSVHPAASGVQGPLVETLLEFGAAANGVRDDGSPIMTAIASGYPAAMMALARGGARVDTVIAAASLGRLDLVRRFVSDARTLVPGVPLVAPRGLGLPDEPKAHIERAFISACRLGHAGVVAFLLDAGVNIAASDDMTGLHWAAGHRYADVVRLLLSHGAPLEVKNRWGGTVLDSTLWFAMHPPTGHPHGVADVGYVAILEMLITAGADLGALERGLTGLSAIDELLRRHGHT